MSSNLAKVVFLILGALFLAIAGVLYFKLTERPLAASAKVSPLTGSGLAPALEPSGKEANEKAAMAAQGKEGVQVVDGADVPVMLKYYQELQAQQMKQREQDLQEGADHMTRDVPAASDQSAVVRLEFIPVQSVSQDPSDHLHKTVGNTLVNQSAP